MTKINNTQKTNLNIYNANSNVNSNDNELQFNHNLLKEYLANTQNLLILKLILMLMLIVI